MSQEKDFIIGDYPPPKDGDGFEGHTLAELEALLKRLENLPKGPKPERDSVPLTPEIYCMSEIKTNTAEDVTGPELKVLAEGLAHKPVDQVLHSVVCLGLSDVDAFILFCSMCKERQVSPIDVADASILSFIPEEKQFAQSMIEKLSKK